ncbi:MAG: YqjK family protein [Betaproteobacteria bacterium]
MIYAERLSALASKKGRLVAECARQRLMLADELAGWEARFRTVDRGIAAARFIKAHPVAIAAVVGLVAMVGRRQLLRWAGRGLLVWRSLQTVRTVLRTLAA